MRRSFPRRWIPSRLVATGAACAVLASGCLGRIGGSPDDPDGGLLAQDDVVRPPQDGDGITTLPDGGALPAACTAAQLPGVPYLRRLTNNEYAASVRDLTDETSDITHGFQPDPLVAGFAFRNDADALVLTQAYAQQYQTASEAVSAHVVASATRRTQVFGCDPSVAATRTQCIASFIQSFGARAFRRPVGADEAHDLAALAATASGSDPYLAAELVLQAILQSPGFLFRVEQGVADPSRPGVFRLTGYEMATRLSYTLLGTTPDATLLAAAEAGGLDTVDGVAMHARAMLADPHAHDAVRTFYTQWLQLDQLGSVQLSSAAYPQWNATMQNAMVEETSRFVDDLVWRDGADFLDLLTARYSYVDPLLAGVYGVTAPDASGFARIDFPTDSERGGILTQGSYLALGTLDDEGSPIERGKFVREVLLCQLLPPPPANVPVLGSRPASQSQREWLAGHRTDPSCSGCHNLMDPTGFGLERFDALGGYHTTDAQGRPLTGQGQLAGYDPVDFTGPIELSQRLHDLPDVSNCIVRQAFRYAYGRMDGDGDACTVAVAQSVFHGTHDSFREMVLAIVTSDGFRFVADPATATGGGM